MTHTHTETIREAAQIIRANAETLRECHARADGEWGSSPEDIEAREQYDREMEIANRLEVAASHITHLEGWRQGAIEIAGYLKRAVAHAKQRSEQRAEPSEYIQQLEDRLFSAGAMEQAPCFCCGYSGPRYYQPDTHPCAKRHHELRHGVTGD